MNKKLFEKVKSKCKDTGLSEKYLIAITEKMSGSIEDDSTDEDEIEKTANLIADVAKESQGEATRWANKKKPTKKAKEEEEEEEEEDDDSEGKKKKGKVANENDALEKRLKELEDKLGEYETKKKKDERAKEIDKAMEKHNIPSYLRKRLAKSIDDEEEVDDAVAALKQDLITNGLVDEHSGGSKAASEKQIDEAAGDLLESITVK